MDGAGNVVIAGGSGFIGRHLAAAFREDGYRVEVIGRSGPGARWDDPETIHDLIDGADVLINMAGKSVDCRYNDRNRDEILRSRVDTTRQLREAVQAAASPPGVWLNSSTATTYRYALDRPMTEADGDLGTGFSVDVARNWERELLEGDLPGTRRVALRMAIVLGDGAATRRVRGAVRLGLGGPQYDGWWFQHKRYRGIGPDPSGDGQVHSFQPANVRTDQSVLTEPDGQHRVYDSDAPGGRTHDRAPCLQMDVGAGDVRASLRVGTCGEKPVGAAREAG